jgi:hypothetical protein
VEYDRQLRAASLDGERLWAVEDCRQLTGWLERQLLCVGEEQRQDAFLASGAFESS